MATVLRRTPALHVFRFLCVNGFEREVREVQRDYEVFCTNKTLRYTIVSNNFLHHFLSIHRLENILVVARAYYINVKFYDPKLKPNFQRLSYTFPSVQVFHAFLRLVFLPVAKQVELWGVERVDKRFVEVCKDTVAKYPHIRFHVVLNEDADECRTVLDVLKSQVVSMFSRRPSFLFQMHGAPLRRLDLSGMKYVYPFFAMNVKHVKMGLATFLHTRWPQNPSVERLIFKPSPIQRHRQPGEAFAEIKRCFPNLKLIVIKQLTYLPAEEQTVDEFLDYIRTLLPHWLQLIGFSQSVANVRFCFEFYPPGVQPQFAIPLERLFDEELGKRGARRIKAHSYQTGNSGIELRVGTYSHRLSRFSDFE